MKASSIIYIFITSFNLTKALNLCKNSSSKREICSLVFNYDRGRPNQNFNDTPTEIKQDLFLDGIAEFNEKDNTITVNVEITLEWNDTRITTNDSNDSRYCIKDESPRGKKILEQLSKQRFFTEFENRALSSLLCRSEEKPVIFELHKKTWL